MKENKANENSKGIRLDKYLSDMSVASRSDIKSMIRKSRITVNGEIIRDTGAHVSLSDTICADGKRINHEELSYYMLNKPSGVLSAAMDKKALTCVDLIGEENKRKDLFPAGRLDKDTEGLILITNDGELAHSLLTPKKHVDKVYSVVVLGVADENCIEKIKQGFKIDEDIISLPAKAEVIYESAEENISWLLLTIHEGKFHEIKKMFEALGRKVVHLRRIAFGPLLLDDSLCAGAYRRLLKSEIEALKKNVQPPEISFRETAKCFQDEYSAENLLKGIQAVIFDFDGTLVDSMWMWHQIDVDYLKRFNIECPQEIQKCIEGMSFSECAIYFKKRFNLKDSLDKIKEDWNEMTIENYRTKVKLKKGALNWLSYLKNNGIKIAIASSNSKELLNAALVSIGISEYFDCVHVSCEVPKGKPSPDVYLFTAEDLGIKPEECLVFEDISQGLIAAKLAGMKTVGVYDDFSVYEQELKKELSDYYLRDFDNIAGTILP